MECFKCGISENEALLFDAISSKGIIKICEKCSREEDIPIINKPISSQINEYKKKVKEPRNFRKTVVSDRLSRISGIKVEDGRERKSLELLKEEDELKKIADKNFQKRLEGKQSQKPYLVNNFHWIIMRARRLKKITVEQLAREILEPESAIKMAEKGILPKEDKKLIKKLENKLEIRLIKEEFIDEIKKSLEKPFSEEIKFRPDETNTLTISDLQEMKKQREAEIFEKSIENPRRRIELINKEEISEARERKKEDTYEKDLSDKKINDLIFGRK
jgi:ribosome-binding protein aMBF1 (putative translation factor)